VFFLQLPDLHVQGHGGGRSSARRWGRRRSGAFQTPGSDHVGMGGVSVRVEPAGIEGMETGGQNDRSDLQFQGLFLFFVAHRFNGADLRADAALLAMAQLAAVWSIDA